MGETFAEKKQAAEKHRDQMMVASPLSKILGDNKK